MGELTSFTRLATTTTTMRKAPKRATDRGYLVPNVLDLNDGGKLRKGLIRPEYSSSETTAALYLDRIGLPLEVDVRELGEPLEPLPPVHCLRTP